MRVSDFQASIFHLTWMVQIPVSTSRRNRNIRELLHCPPSFNELPERGICHLALQMPTLPRKSGGLRPALPLATRLFLSFCPAPSICLHPQVHPPTSHLQAFVFRSLTLWLEERTPHIRKLLCIKLFTKTPTSTISGEPHWYLGSGFPVTCLRTHSYYHSLSQTQG